MNRILVLGCAGSGKSTLSQNLSAMLNLPVIHLDSYYWKPSWIPSSDDEFDKIVERITMEDRWIIDGNYSRTMDKRLERAELIILLDLPRYICLYRIFKRRIKYHKKSRPDMNEGCVEKIDWEFIKWVWNYRKRSRMITIQKLQKIEEAKQIVILKTSRQVTEFIKKVKRSC